ncbi:MAG: CPBP family intramembrane glutamic endopeptidase [Vicinamibacterales bacterium]
MMARRQWVSLGEVVLCSGFPSQLLLGLLAIRAGFSPGDQATGLALPFVAAVALADTAVLAALMAFFIRRRGDSVSAVYLGGRSTWREAALGLLLVPLVLVFISTTIVVLGRVAPWLHTVPQNPFGLMAATPEAAVLLAIVALVAGGLREELQRGFLLQRFKTDLGGLGVGLVLTSVTFGLGHVQQGWDAVIVTMSLGLFWALLYVARSSIVAAVISHGLANAIQVAVAYLQQTL